jgi:hypothetical protein
MKGRRVFQKKNVMKFHAMQECRIILHYFSTTGTNKTDNLNKQRGKVG